MTHFKKVYLFFCSMDEKNFVLIDFMEEEEENIKKAILKCIK